MFTIDFLTSRAWVDVRLDSIRHNVQAIRAYVGVETQIMAVVKADAYGHGLLPVAKAALEAGAACLGVATVGEGVLLRKAGIRTPITLLCNPTPQEAAAIVAQNLTIALGDRAMLSALVTATRAQRSASDPLVVSLDIDTGMGRSGVVPEEAVSLWREMVAAGLCVTGLTTHFAEANNEESQVLQKERFDQAFRSLNAVGARFDQVHLSNSEATLSLKAAGGNLVRPGLLIYGITPAHPDLPSAGCLRGLAPALTLSARVATVRALPEGSTISYGGTYRLRRPSRVATILLGYGDGYPRRLSNKGHMLLHGLRAPILGRICMDQTVVDVTDIPQTVPGDIAIAIGGQTEDRITIEQLAALIETTEHEITTCLTSRLPRRYLPDGSSSQHAKLSFSG